MIGVRPLAWGPLAIFRVAAFAAIPLVVFFAATFLVTTPAGAQHSGAENSAPPPPAGNGSLTVRVIHLDDPTQAAGLSIALYALSSDGSPGFAGGETNAEGVYTFTGISTDPGIVYLVGARFQEIPFGERLTFAEGETEARVEIEVMTPTDRTNDVRLEELRIRLDWMGDRIIVHEVLLLSNSGDRVVQVAAEDESRSIVLRKLQSGAHDFSPGPGSIGDGIALEEAGIRFWGPLYPGTQRIEYQYSLPLDATSSKTSDTSNASATSTPSASAEGGALRVSVALNRDVARIVVIAGTSGLGLKGARLVAAGDLESDSGPSRKTWTRDGLPAGESFEIELTLPETRRDPTLISIPRGDVWLELDDTRLTATVKIQIEVAPGAPVTGSPEAPLLRISIPKGATLQGVAPEAEALGLIPTGDPSGKDAGFDVVGPIGPGATSLGYSYFMPARPEGIQLEMRFPGEIQTLNVMIADTGLAIDSRRLHRLRPFRSGTRNYLHREAFNLARNEVVGLSLVPLGPTGLPHFASISLAIAAAAAGAFFLFAPLRSAPGEVVAPESPMDRLRTQRELVYTAIRDLDHDFETAKLEEGDYTQMRESLRAEAIELMRSEQAAAVADQAEVDQASASTSSGAARVADTSEARTDRFCPSCGDKVVPQWRFCSHCGETLSPSEQATG